MGARAHDSDDVYLRLQLGVAFAGVAAKSSTTHLEFAGTGPSLGVALGKTVRPDLALFGTFSLSSAIDPSLKRNGANAPPIAGSVDQVLFGIGIAYYLEPSNLFMAASAGISKLNFQDSQNVVLYESKWGGGGELLAGKEWWVSDQWGLGVSGQLSLATARGKGALSPGESTPTWTGAAFSILFSSTYN